MANYILGIVCFLVGFILAWFIGRRRNKPSQIDGTIFLDKNTDGDDRIVFALDFEYDEIASKEKIVFNVVDKNKGL